MKDKKECVKKCNLILTNLRSTRKYLDFLHDHLNRNIDTHISPHITGMRKKLAEMEEELQYIEYRFKGKMEG